MNKAGAGKLRKEKTPEEKLCFSGSSSVERCHRPVGNATPSRTRYTRSTLPSVSSGAPTEPPLPAVTAVHEDRLPPSGGTNPVRRRPATKHRMQDGAAVARLLSLFRHGLQVVVAPAAAVPPVPVQCLATPDVSRLLAALHPAVALRIGVEEHRRTRIRHRFRGWAVQPNWSSRPSASLSAASSSNSVAAVISSTNCPYLPSGVMVGRDVFGGIIKLLQHQIE